MDAPSNENRNPHFTFDVALEGDNLIDAALETVRSYFGMPVAYVSQFKRDQSVFRNVSAPGLEHLIKPFDQRCLNEIYCPYIVVGRLPNIIPDTSKEPICRDMPITDAIPIGSHVSLPITLEDGSVYGMFCCLLPEANPTLNDRDAVVMSSFLTLVTRQVRREERLKRQAAKSRAWIDELLHSSSFRPVFQPIVQLSDDVIVGMEALSRFDTSLGLGVEEIFKSVEEAGLGNELELVTLKKALDDYLGVMPSAYIALNASPNLICDDRFKQLLPVDRLGNVIIEVTEHSQAEDNVALNESIFQLRSAGARIAIDDVGAGYSGLLRIAQLQPELLKIDQSLIQGIHCNQNQQAIVSSLVHFARESRCKLLGEGVEVPEDAKALRELGVDLAQGWLYGRPEPIAFWTSKAKDCG